MSVICQAPGNAGAMELRQPAEILQSLFECLFIGPINSNVDYQGLICPMSSPFAIFRKNQKLWMAGAVFIAIVSFVIAPMIEYFSGSRRSGRPGISSRRGDNPVLASWNGGSIRMNELDREWQQVYWANTFLRKLATDVREKGGMPNVPEFAPDLSLVGITSDRDTKERIVERKLLVAEANRMGIHFDDESVKIFLKRFVDGKLDGEQIKTALKVATNGQMNLFDFNRLMREELAKNEVLRLAGTGLRFEDRRESRTLGRPALTTPSKNWQDFLKFNRAAKIQAFPVFVNDFESQVKNKPTEKEIQEIYKTGKDITRSRRTIATQPAFRRPKTSNFEFLSIDVERIITEQMALVPEETLRAEYERRVKEKQFRVPVVQEAIGTSTTEPSTTEPSTPPATAPPNSTQGAPAIPPVSETTSPSAASASPSAPNGGTDSPPAVPPILADPKDNASVQRKSLNIKLVSFQEEKPAATTQTEPAASANPAAPANPTSPADPAAQTEPTAKIEVSDPKPTETAPGLPTFPQTGIPQAGDGIAESTPMRTKTFDEVREQIAREQATALAYKVVEERIDELVGPMSIYQSEVRAYQSDLSLKVKTAKAPAPMDLAKLGKELGFEHGTTGLVDQESIQGTSIGTSFVMPGQGMQPFSFAMLINESEGYGELYTPVVSLGFTGGNKRYLSWKTEETQPMTPSIDAVRTQTEEVWRKQQAFKLAETRAREIASKVGSLTLKDSLATPEEKTLVQEPTNFTWFNPMFARMESRLQLSNVELLQPVDDSFMETVFAAKPNETVVAADSNKTVYYVVQVLELTPEINSLFERFAAAPLEGVSTVSQLESDRALQPWFQNLQKQLGFRAD